VTEWQPSGPEPGKDGPGNLSRAAQIAINRPEVRNARHPGNPFELPGAPPASRLAVIILTTAPCPDGVGPHRP
jgi:1,4-dihydroxy-2-naphthoyl-CoA synthase